MSLRCILHSLFDNNVYKKNFVLNLLQAWLMMQVLSHGIILTISDTEKNKPGRENLYEARCSVFTFF